jgi:hypothetical protein
MDNTTQDEFILKMEISKIKSQNYKSKLKIFGSFCLFIWHFVICILLFDLLWWGSLTLEASAEITPIHVGNKSQQESSARLAAVYFSDGKVLTGEISLAIWQGQALWL